ncbi:hypothetical protein LguiB_001175 [Lonicera macranthoides]
MSEMDQSRALAKKRGGDRECHICAPKGFPLVRGLLGVAMSARCTCQEQNREGKGYLVVARVEPPKVDNILPGSHANPHIREVNKLGLALGLERPGSCTNCPVVSPDQERGGSSKSAKSVSVLHTKIQIGDDPRAEEKFQWKGYDDAVEEFARFFQEINGNDFESREIK